MKNTTLCYIENERGEYLMLHRVKKQNDLNHDKWIGVGGKCEEGESPEECVCRETLEETGLMLTDYRYRGVITFVSDIWEGEYMHLFTATGWTGTLRECDEGVLEWLHKDALAALPQWEGDKLFLALIHEPDTPFFSMKLQYAGDTLSWRYDPGERVPAGLCLSLRRAEQAQPAGTGAGPAWTGGAGVPGAAGWAAYAPKPLRAPGGPGGDERWPRRDGGVPPGCGGSSAFGAPVRLYRRRAEGEKPLLRLRAHL